MEHEFEAELGLPEPLPTGERILWQGAPEFHVMARRCFHVRTLTFYFAIILFIRSATVVAQGGSFADGAVAALWLLPAAALALSVLYLMAYLTSHTAVYTITDRRVIMRIGIVLTVTFNLPFSRIEAAAINVKHGPVGDIVLTLAGTDRIAYAHLWPHARPWRVAKAEPTLRCIADASAVARTLAAAWSAARGIAVPEVVSSQRYRPDVAAPGGVASLRPASQGSMTAAAH